MSPTARILTGLAAGALIGLLLAWWDPATAVRAGSSQPSKACIAGSAIAVQPAVASVGDFHRWAKMQLPAPGTACALCSITKPRR